jgi:hypothetical protein
VTITGYNLDDPRQCLQRWNTWNYILKRKPFANYIYLFGKVTITGYNLDDPRQCLQRWNTVVQAMNEQCNEVLKGIVSRDWGGLEIVK